MKKVYQLSRNFDVLLMNTNLKTVQRLQTFLEEKEKSNKRFADSFSCLALASRLALIMNNRSKRAYVEGEYRDIKSGEIIVPIFIDSGKDDSINDKIVCIVGSHEYITKEAIRLQQTNQ